MADTSLRILAQDVRWCMKPECRAELRRRPLPLEVETSGKERLWFSVLQCTSCGAMYARRGDLHEGLQHAGVDLRKIESFSDWRGPVDVSGWFGQRSEPMHWEAFRAKVAEKYPEEGVPDLLVPARGRSDLSDVEEVRQTWAIGVHPYRFGLEQNGNGVPAGDADAAGDAADLEGTLVVLVDGSGQVLARDVYAADPVPVGWIGELVVQQATDPPRGARRKRPYRMIAGRGIDAEELEAALGGTVRVEDGSVSRLENALEEVVSTRPSFENALPVHLADRDREEARRFVSAASDLFGRAPWERMDSRRLIGIRMSDGAWHYLEVSDPDRGAFGVTYYEDWLTACRTINNPGDYHAPEVEPEVRVGPFAAAGGLENVLLPRRIALHPRDVFFIEDLGSGRFPARRLPGIVRIGGEGYPAQPARSPGFYATVLEALAGALGDREGAVERMQRTEETRDGPVRIVYPATGEEEREAEPSGVCFVLHEGTRAEADRRIEVDVPATTPVHEILEQVGGLSEAPGLRISALWQGGSRLYFRDLEEAGLPAVSPLAAQIVGLGNLAVETASRDLPVTVESLEAPVSEPEIQIRS